MIQATLLVLGLTLSFDRVSMLPAPFCLIVLDLDVDLIHGRHHFAWLEEFAALTPIKGEFEVSHLLPHVSHCVEPYVSADSVPTRGIRGSVEP